MMNERAALRILLSLLLDYLTPTQDEVSINTAVITNHLALMEKRIMATVQELKDATLASLDALRATVEAEKQEVIAALAGVTDQVAALQNQIAQGDVVPPETIVEIQSAITAVSDQVAAIQA
jgi:phage I-like protein